jgi:hypothetical protein
MIMSDTGTGILNIRAAVSSSNYISIFVSFGNGL